MADLTLIRNALAAQITAVTGLRAEGQARDQISPPMAVVLPANPFITYQVTMDGAVTVNLTVLIAVAASYTPDAQKALDAYLGFGPGEQQSIAEAIHADETLGGTVNFAEAISAGGYGNIDFGGVTYFGARVSVQCGAM